MGLPVRCALPNLTLDREEFESFEPFCRKVSIYSICRWIQGAARRAGRGVREQVPERAAVPVLLARAAAAGGRWDSTDFNGNNGQVLSIMEADREVNGAALKEQLRVPGVRPHALRGLRCLETPTSGPGRLE